MNFLEKIDDIYRTTKEMHAVQRQSTPFSCFIPVLPAYYVPTCEFVIKKSKLAKLLIISGGQRVYMSDLQIINTILDMDGDSIDWFLQRFITLYLGAMCPIEFEIDGERFTGYGIENYPKEKKLLLFSDTLIDINDFIFLLNFVFSKDKAWEDMNEIKDFSKRTLSKYIALIDYYANSAERSRAFLETIGYPVESKKPIDNKNIKILFSTPEKFDISVFK